MSWSLTLDTAPAAEPITTAEAKTHARISTGDDDAYVGALITAARRLAETVLKRQLVTATWLLNLDRFPHDRAGDVSSSHHHGLHGFRGEIEIPLPPLQSIGAINYIDTDGVSQLLAATEYQVDTDLEPGRVMPAFDKFWPSTRLVYNAVIVTFDAGYGAADDVPEDIKLAIKILVAHWYEAREPIVDGSIANVPTSFEALLQQYRVRMV